jgi:hypothetical protein
MVRKSSWRELFQIIFAIYVRTKGKLSSITGIFFMACLRGVSGLLEVRNFFIWLIISLSFHLLGASVD